MTDEALRHASHVLYERKTALRPEFEAEHQHQPLSPDEVRLLLIGLDVDAESAIELATKVGAESLATILAGAPPFCVCSGSWFDGLLTGLLVAEVRHQEAV